MSDSVHCDHCGKEGRRPKMYPAPKDWLYLEAVDPEDEEEAIIMWACSPECAKAQWKKGPGERLDHGHSIFK